jgi:hypothetical protein
MLILDERAHVQRLQSFWQQQLDRLLSGIDLLSGDGRQRVEDLAVMTRARVKAYEERLQGEQQP